MSQARWLLLHAITHASAFVLLLWAAFHTTDIAGIVIALIAGIACSHILHEWGHYLGARLSGALVTIKPKLSPLFFDFDYLKNNPRQFLWLSAGGPAGNLVLIGVTLLMLPLDNLVQQFFLATLIGKLVYVITLEGPVTIGILAGGKPLEVLGKHFGQGKPLFRRCMMLGAFSGLLVFSLLAASTI